jgi:hypothetical protein
LDKDKNKGIDHKCVPKSKLAPARSKRDVVTTTTTTTSPKHPLHLAPTSHDLSKCSSYAATSLKLHLYQTYDHLLSHNNTNNTTSEPLLLHPTCSSPISRLFGDVDKNGDAKVDFYEWLGGLATAVNTATSDLGCRERLFFECDKKEDRYLSLDEVCECFEGVRPTCSYVRDLSSHAYFAEQYLASLSGKLGIETKKKKSSDSSDVVVTVKSYAPICDLDGYFQPAQCDNQVTCWCVSKDGEPVTNSLKRISETQFKCN